MARLSDIIESFIKGMLQESDENILEIQRNELANHFNCAPSQINYVLTTRFTIDQGYYIESKRGGGGCIKITRIEIDRDDYIKNRIWDSIGNEITQQDGENFIKFFEENDFVTPREAKIMRVAINDKTLALPLGIKDSIRAQILKTMLIALLD
jgi:transcriptional regulator CtsR